MINKGKQKHLATYKVHYPQTNAMYRDCWETALETDMPQYLDYLTGSLLWELVSCEPNIDKLEIDIHFQIGKDYSFQYLSQLPVWKTVVIEDVGMLREYMLDYLMPIRQQED